MGIQLSVAEILLEEGRIVEQRQRSWEVERLVAGLAENAKEKLGERIITAQYFGYFAILGSRIWGGVWGYVWGKRGEILHLWIDPMVRGHGIGSVLCDKFEQKAWEEGAACLTLWTGDYEAPEFYTSRGYTIAAQVPSAIPDHTENLLMRYRPEHV